MQILNDTEIRKLLGTIIIDGVEKGVRPNAYIMRLGSNGEFHKTVQKIYPDCAICA